MLKSFLIYEKRKVTAYPNGQERCVSANPQEFRILTEIDTVS